VLKNLTIPIMVHELKVRPKGWCGVSHHCMRPDSALKLSQLPLLMGANRYLEVRTADPCKVCRSPMILMDSAFELNEKTHKSTGQHSVKLRRQPRPQQRCEHRSSRDVYREQPPDRVRSAQVMRGVEAKVELLILTRHEWADAAPSKFNVRGDFVLSL